MVIASNVTAQLKALVDINLYLYHAGLLQARQLDPFSLNVIALQGPAVFTLRKNKAKQEHQCCSAVLVIYYQFAAYNLQFSYLRNKSHVSLISFTGL